MKHIVIISIIISFLALASCRKLPVTETKVTENKVYGNTIRVQALANPRYLKEHTEFGILLCEAYNDYEEIYNITFYDTLITDRKVIENIINRIPYLKNANLDFFSCNLDYEILCCVKNDEEELMYIAFVPNKFILIIEGDKERLALHPEIKRLPLYHRLKKTYVIYKWDKKFYAYFNIPKKSDRWREVIRRLDNRAKNNPQ